MGKGSRGERRRQAIGKQWARAAGESTGGKQLASNRQAVVKP